MDSIGSTMAAVAAHRGWHQDGAPENSIDALRRAAANGADKAEADIRQLGDGTLVVHHDATIAGTPLEQLDRSVLASHPDIATLDDWAREAGRLDIGVLAEFKAHGYERQGLDVLRRAVPAHRLEAMSFQSDVVRELRRLLPDRPVGKLSDLPHLGGSTGWTPAANLVADARATGASFLGLNLRQSTEPVLAAAHRAGLGVAVWTVDRPADIARLLADTRVSTVITDAPRLALDLRGAAHGFDAARSGLRLLQAAAHLR